MRALALLLVGCTPATSDILYRDAVVHSPDGATSSVVVYASGTIVAGGATRQIPDLPERLAYLRAHKAELLKAPSGILQATPDVHGSCTFWIDGEKVDASFDDPRCQMVSNALTGALPR